MHTYKVRPPIVLTYTLIVGLLKFTPMQNTHIGYLLSRVSITRCVYKTAYPCTVDSRASAAPPKSVLKHLTWLYCQQQHAEWWKVLLIVRTWHMAALNCSSISHTEYVRQIYKRENHLQLSSVGLNQVCPDNFITYLLPDQWIQVYLQFERNC